MEKEINELKLIYLDIKPNLEMSEDYTDILKRLERMDEKTFFKSKFFYAGILIFIIFLLTTGIFIIPENNIAKALKGVYETKSATINKFTSNFQNLKVKQKKYTTPTPTPKVTKQITPTIFENKNYETSENKSFQKHSQNGEDIKGITTENSIITTSPSPSRIQNQIIGKENSDENRNENSVNNPSNDNPSSEKSNGKSKD